MWVETYEQRRETLTPRDDAGRLHQFRDATKMVMSRESGLIRCCQVVADDRGDLATLRLK